MNFLEYLSVVTLASFAAAVSVAWVSPHRRFARALSTSALVTFLPLLVPALERTSSPDDDSAMFFAILLSMLVAVVTGFLGAASVEGVRMRQASRFGGTRDAPSVTHRASDAKKSVE